MRLAVGRGRRYARRRRSWRPGGEPGRRWRRWGGGYVGGGGGSTGSRGSRGGGGGSSFGPAGTTYATALLSRAPQVTISWTAGAPSASIATPVRSATYTQGAAVDASFTCAEDAGGPGVSSCVDGSGKTTGDPLDTASTGVHTLMVTATSSDGLSATASVTYTVAAAATATAATTTAPPTSQVTPSTLTLVPHGVDPFVTGEHGLPVRLACAGATSCALTVAATIALPGTQRTLQLHAASDTLGARQWTTVWLHDSKRLRAIVRRYALRHPDAHVQIGLTVTSAAPGGTPATQSYSVRMLFP
ncbi:MAG: hypothetical protein ACRDLP_15435 [Solirubrobacteraceae bacterium]